MVAFPQHGRCHGRSGARDLGADEIGEGRDHRQMCVFTPNQCVFSPQTEAQRLNAQWPGTNANEIKDWDTAFARFKPGAYKSKELI